jgi:hypothetical protein
VSHAPCAPPQSGEFDGAAGRAGLSCSSIAGSTTLYPGDLRAVVDAMDLARVDAFREDATDRTRPIALVGTRGDRGDKSRSRGADPK